jgi:hypothetical protein
MIDSRLLAASAALLCSVTVSAAGAGAAAPRYRMAEVPEPQFRGRFLPARLRAQVHRNQGSRSRSRQRQSLVRRLHRHRNRFVNPHLASVYRRAAPRAYELALPTEPSADSRRASTIACVWWRQHRQLKKSWRVMDAVCGHEPGSSSSVSGCGCPTGAGPENQRVPSLVGVRQNCPSAALPLDQFCITGGWVIRTPAGATILRSQRKGLPWTASTN